jgi:protein phosphatase-4 regulatory subunit 3
VDIVNHIQNNDSLLVELLSVFKGQTASPIQDDSPLDQKKRDTLMFLHQLFTLAKPLQAIGRIALYRGLIDRGLLHVVEWAFRRREAPILHTASEILTFTLEHDTNAVRHHILKEHDADATTLLAEMIGIQGLTDNTGLASHLSDSIRHLLDIPHEGEVSYSPRSHDSADDQSIFVRKEGPLADNFITFFYETSASQLFRPITDLPHMDSESTSTYRKYECRLTIRPPT